MGQIRKPPVRSRGLFPKAAGPSASRPLWRYMAETEKMIAETCREGRKRLLRRYLAQRRNLYAKCVNMGDMRAATTCWTPRPSCAGYSRMS